MINYDSAKFIKTRKKHNHTQEQLAIKSGLSIKTIINIEHGRPVKRGNLLCVISTFREDFGLDVRIDDFILNE